MLSKCFFKVSKAGMNNFKPGIFLFQDRRCFKCLRVFIKGINTGIFI